MRFSTSIAMMLALAFSQSACATRSIATSTKEVSMSDLKQQIADIQKTALMPGLQVIVTEGQNTIFEYTNGLRAEGFSDLVTPNDKWHIGSCTKPMTAFLIGRLVDKKLIGWTTTLSEIAPSNYELHPSVKTITVEQLLSHSSGLADVTEPENGKLWSTLFAEASQTAKLRERLVQGILKMPVRFTPGSKSEYSNSGYVVLGWIAEQLLKKSWEQSLKTEIFEPLQMTCGFGPAGIENPKVPLQPWSHHLENDQIQSIPPGVQADNPLALGPAGTVHCSTQDWRKFLRLFLDEERSKSNLLTQATYDKLLSNTGDGPYTFSSIGRMERPWAKGAVYAMAGSNTFNYAIVAVAPKLNRILTINTNAGHAKAEEAVTKILKMLTELK